MNIFGIGGAEMVAIFVIMLVVAGPKRMAQWAYIAGKYISKIRAMWGETMAMVQREFDEAGIDIEVPKQMPSRGNFQKSVNRAVENAMKPVSDPLKQTLDDATADIKAVEKDLGDVAKSVKETDDSSAKTEAEGSNGSAPSLGSWSSMNKSD